MKSWENGIAHDEKSFLLSQMTSFRTLAQAEEWGHYSVLSRHLLCVCCVLHTVYLVLGIPKQDPHPALLWRNLQPSKGDGRVRWQLHFSESREEMKPRTKASHTDDRMRKNTNRKPEKIHEGGNPRVKPWKTNRNLAGEKGWKEREREFPTQYPRYKENTGKQSLCLEPNVPVCPY